MRRVLVAALCLGLPMAAHAQAGHEGYYRTPAIYGNTVVFAAEGDLWRVGVEGGLAQRLTTHLEEESHPAISPDGKWIAFSASYEGPSEVYTIPIAGGLPRRWTYDGEDATVVGWTPTGRILYATRKFSTLPNQQLVELDPVDGSRQVVPLAQAADGSYDRPGGTLYFTRFSKQGSNTKRYRGGTAQDLWKFATGADEAVPLTPDYPGTSRTPMWWDGRIYFVTDRDGTMNIWSMGPEGGDLRQHTRHRGWDALEPSLQDGRIVYRVGADLRIYDIQADRDRELAITLASDLDQMRLKWVDEPMEYLSAAAISPDGERLALTSRGEVFVSPVRSGRFVQATRRPDVRYADARFMPDGESLVVMSDESGEVEWWKLSASGLGEAVQLTDNGHVLRLDGAVSPDGNWLVSYNHDQEMWLYDLRKGAARQIDFSARWGYDGPAWSPDSKWFVYAKPASNGFWQVLLYHVGTGQRVELTSDRYDSWSPTWSADGRWIYFLSDRHFESLVRSPWGSRQPEPFFDRATRIYMIALRDGQRSPFAPPDELHAGGTEPATGTSGAEKDGEGMPDPVEIDLDGIRERLHTVPVEPGNYRALSVSEKRLFWARDETSLERETSLLALEIDDERPEPKKLVGDIESYELSADGSKILIRKGDAFYVIDASAGGDTKLDDARVDLSDWRFSIDPREEWRQLFVDSWRLERDYFYDRDMHGVDWRAMLDKYMPLVDRVTTRAELSDLQAQMASELSALHTYVGGGDHRDDPQEIAPASLGAVLQRDEAAAGYRVAHIYRSDPDDPEQLAPLARPGVNVRAGDVIEAINGIPTLSVADVGELLLDQAGEQVRLRVRSGNTGPRDVIVKAISASRERDLRYDEWEYTRRLTVDSLSEGTIGYVHLRAMGSRNMSEWHRDYYPVFDRQGLVIDVRHNRGGNIDSWILGRLLRRAWFYWQPRVGDPYWNMQYAFRGHMVVLVDEWTASDGEAFAEGFRRLDLGQLIGTRTWGGEIWLTGSNRLLDRGVVTASEFGVYGPEGVWLIEGHGVDPDIVVDNLPHATFNGEDAQLAAAIEHLRRLIAEDPRPVPPAPPYPDKSFRATTRAGTQDDS